VCPRGQLNAEVWFMRKLQSSWCGCLLLLVLAACSGDDSAAPPEPDDAGDEPEPDSGPMPPDNVCGDGRIGAGEQCDDGNTASGDGCSSTCQDDEDCSVPGACDECGNGTLEAEERCDEGDFADGVGCSDDCRTVGENFRCVTPGEACAECGDGMVTADEVCDDQNTESGDGCVETCLAIESGWSCPEAGGACALCGDGVVDDGEECDDQNFVAGDGCSDGCMLETGATCLQAGVQCTVCGNGFIEFIALDDNDTPDDPSDDFYDTEDPNAVEGCDDGNSDDGDGCSAACSIEDGGDLPWVCPLPGVGCGRCGDGEVQAIETCDDSNVDSDDGCSSDCTAVETGYLCPPEGGACVVCGDGTLDEDLEACDDGNALSGDGCNRKCEIETDVAWLCPTAGEPCELCGNGVQETNEACDDGNAEGDDGCAADCQAEEEDYNCYFDGFACAPCGDGMLQPGEGCDEGHIATVGNLTAGCVDCARTDSWSCPAAGAPCELCGDGVIGDGDPFTAFETCDDGNTDSMDGCSSTCQVEPGYVCNGDSCTAASCGDGFVATGEECDDGARMAGDGCSFLCRVEPGYDCSGSAGCRRTLCGDGIVEGDEQCDDGVATGGDGCSADCELEEGWKCEQPGLPCEETACGDGLVEGTEQCDVGGVTCDPGGCVPLDANGCDVDCQLKPNFKCEPGDTCTGANAATDCCTPTTCGDGLIEGTEQCDDGPTAAGPGCGADCIIDDFYRCEPGELGASECRPIVEYVSIRRFRVPNISPDALLYNPDRRSFGGHKSTFSMNNPAVELCLDGTVLNQGDTTAGSNGTVYAPGEEAAELPIDCSDPLAVDGEPCYEAPLRPDLVASSNPQGMRDGTFDPVTGDYLFTYDIPGASGTLLVQMPIAFDRDASVDLARYGVQLTFNAFGVTVGEDGDLYAVDADAEVIHVLPRLRHAITGALLPRDPDCATVTPIPANCTTFSSTPAAARQRSAASDNPLDAIFTLPGESLVGVFNTYTGAPTYQGTDLLSGGTFNTANAFSIYDTQSLDAPRRSALPGVLFSLGEDGTSYSNAAQAAETAADGGAFILCAFTSSQDCQLFARVCEADGDCPPGTLCNTGNVSSGGVGFCNAPGEARDDTYQVERDVYKTCTSTGAQNGLDCTASDTACLAESGTCAQVGTIDPIPLDVLANDSLSESACVDPRFTIIAVCGDGVQSQYEMDEEESCPIEPEPIGTVTFDEDDGEITYDAPEDGSCGFFDTFVYTVDLGGGVIDTAQVRVAVNCVCGDGITDGSEQCDEGEFNGIAGTCVENCADVDTSNDVLARCSDSCLLNVLCGDGYIVAPEECDDSNTDNGDGCSSVCTRESECGNGTVEPGEECDAGATSSATCTVSCVLRECGDGNLDTGRGEQCDDGNLRVGDGCGATCQIEARCGNRIVEPSEDCDDGNTVPGDGCSQTCRVENVCGNGIREGAEVCDGAQFGSCPVVSGTQIQCVNSQSGAPNICLCMNYCGDSKIGGTEECDDGAAGSSDCRGADPDDGDPCTEIRCGDGIVDDGETCDDGNTNPADACSNSCTPRTSCGNGTVESGEECDDDNNISGDGCTSTCQTEAESCGDEVVDADEQCDDGNTMSGDGCSANCRLEGATCGDGTKDVGEQCDDGNTRSGDGCSSACRVELE
jgi:cysteine-rich repeat protein